MIGLSLTPAICAIVTSQAPNAFPSGFFDRMVTVQGVEHKYVVHVPPGIKPGDKIPAILFLHGAGESGTDGLAQVSTGIGPALMKNRDKWPFIVVFPQKPDIRAEWFDQKKMLNTILSKVEREWKIDKSRLYLTGLSQGGRGTMRLATHLIWDFAAIAPICGWADPKIAAEELVNIPFWGFHGGKDPVVPTIGTSNVVDALKAANAKEAKLTIFPDADHNSWDKAYQTQDLAEWFLQHKR